MNMIKTTRRRLVCAAIAGASLLGAFAIAGPLNPPPGPVSPTGATLLYPGQTLFPFSMTQSGVYRLMGDLDVPSGRDGFRVRASDVTIDLNGFTLRGFDAGENTAGIGFLNTFFLDNLRIENGRISNFGVAIDGDTDIDVHMRGVEVIDCGPTGVVVGDFSTLRDCRFEGSSFLGVSLRFQCVVRDCVFAGHSNIALRVGRDCLVIDSTFDGSGATPSDIGIGTLGFSPASDASSRVIGCTFRDLSIGADLASSALNNLLYRNLFVNCATPIVSTGGDAPSAFSSSTAGPWSNILR